jgi:small subunit ribosomal protein S12e
MAEVDQLTSALQKVLNHGIYQNNLARGLNEACKALEYEHDSEDNRASLCILATNCEDDNYKKLITGLCKTWKVHIYF